MANSELYGKVYDIPAVVIKELKKGLQHGNEKSIGFNRAKNLIDKPTITYQNLKRIKNYFDTHDSKHKDYLVNGGHVMKDWINKLLYAERHNMVLGKSNKTLMGSNNEFKNDFEKDNYKNALEPILFPNKIMENNKKNMKKIFIINSKQFKQLSEEIKKENNNKKFYNKKKG
jgi:hypothetical protein